MQAYRRLTYNHALDHAIRLAAEHQVPLVIYEGLRLGYPWASARLHTFILQGMQENARRAKELGVNYWPFVETPDQPGRGLLRQLSAAATAVVTDDFPAFIVPGQIRALGKQIDCALIAVDSNSIVPLRLLGEACAMAAHMRPRIHKAFAEAWPHRAAAEPEFPSALCKKVDPLFETWKCNDLAAFVSGLPIDQTVRPVDSANGGTTPAEERLAIFLKKRLAGYAEARSAPTPPDEGKASELSPYLHFGHISIEQVITAVLGKKWTPAQLNLANRGKREGYYCDNPDVNSFLDEAITWRDVGFHWHTRRGADTASLQKSLPGWAWTTLQKHTADPREYVYSLEEFETAATHDEIWNAAQTELVLTGRMQNYLRMLWGKKVIEWTAAPDEAYRILEHLNNKYALDGRDPNSYTGILWCFGLFDRPWVPERQIFGTVRYMSSENTGRKFKLMGYLNFVHRLRKNLAAS
jgi:deoxyribodipyrimidine photo-lyase